MADGILAGVAPGVRRGGARAPFPPRL